MLDEDNNRVSKVYAPIIEFLLLGDVIPEDVDFLNTRVFDGSDNLCASRCCVGRVIAPGSLPMPILIPKMLSDGQSCTPSEPQTPLHTNSKTHPTIEVHLSLTTVAPPTFL